MIKKISFSGNFPIKGLGGPLLVVLSPKNMLFQLNSCRESKRYILDNILTSIISIARHRIKFQQKCHQKGQQFPSVPHPGTVQLN